MCFTPAISLTTAIIEFILAIILLFFFKKTVLRNFFLVFILLLGFYQFTEFMVCSSAEMVVWATLGFLTYSFLPAIALHSVLKYLRKKVPLVRIYFIPVIASLVALSFPTFMVKISCNRFFIEAQTVFNQTGFLNQFAYFTYLFYYAGFILLIPFLFYKDFLRFKNKVRRKVGVLLFLSVMLMTVPTFLLILIFPVLGVQFPSVLCKFALVVAIMAFLTVYLENKWGRRKRTYLV